MDIHKILARQLKHVNLSETKMPSTIEEWQSFLLRINNIYHESDEERYLLERSMDLSSHEIMELNKKLENAQEIAELGYWNYDSLSDKLNWSKQLRRMVGLTSSDHAPNYKEFLASVHPEYRNKFDQAMKNAIIKGEKYSMELLVRIADGSYRWHYAVGAPFRGIAPPYTELAGIAMDITKRKETEENLRKLNSQIISSAREVGMADVAVSILHNVGNVLNSVNVSSNLLVENLEKSHFN